MANIDYEKYGIMPVQNKPIDYEKYGITPVARKEPESKPNIFQKMAPSDRIPRASMNVLKDIGSLLAGAPKAVTGAISAIPGGIEKLKKEVPLSYEQVKEDPARAGRNVAGGLFELGGKVSRSPNVIADYLAKIGMIEPQTAVGMFHPPSEEEFAKMSSEFVGGGKKPGDVLLRGTPKELPNLYGIGKTAQILNPLQMTAKNIAKNVIKSKEAARELFSGEGGKYKTLFNQARKEGLGVVKFDPKEINIDAIKSHANPKYVKSLEKFLDTHDIEVAQKAQSDLGKFINEMNKKASMTSSEQEAFTAAEKAQKYLQESMFKGNEKLKSEYEHVTHGYKENVIPYTKNKAIKDYQKGEITEKQLLDRISNKPKITKKHPAIGARKALKPIGYTTAGLLGLDYLTNANSLINKLLGREREE